MTRTIGTPEGTRDRLFSECAACRQVEKAVTGLFKRRGYSELTTPNVEFLDLLTNTGHPLDQTSMLKIVDKTGKILVMRPDNTVAIGRVVANKLGGLPFPQRLYYNQTVFRSDDANTGARSEIDQCGVELLGARGIRADLEVISMAIESLDACGLKDFHIELGHAGYFSALLRQLGVTETEADALRQLVEEKNFTAFDAQLVPYAKTQAGQALGRLRRLFGGVEILDEARGLCDMPDAAAALDYLKELYGELSAAGLSDRVQFDLGLVHRIEYYTGVVFRGYVKGAASNVISGGRYDALIGHVGADIPATGFALDVESVADCLPEPEPRKVDTVVFYDPNCLGKALELMNVIPRQTAVLSTAQTAAEALQEAKHLGAGRVLAVQKDVVREARL